MDLIHPCSIPLSNDMCKSNGLIRISMGLIHPYSIPLLMTCVSLVGKLEL